MSRFSASIPCPSSDPPSASFQAGRDPPSASSEVSNNVLWASAQASSDELSAASLAQSRSAVDLVLAGQDTLLASS
jgi:hypothetical protein